MAFGSFALLIPRTALGAWERCCRGNAKPFVEVVTAFWTWMNFNFYLGQVQKIVQTLLSSASVLPWEIWKRDCFTSSTLGGFEATQGEMHKCYVVVVRVGVTFIFYLCYFSHRTFILHVFGWLFLLCWFVSLGFFPPSDLSLTFKCFNVELVIL